jgi:class 3 adenylate cyclase
MPASLARRVTEQHTTGESLGEPVDGTVMALRITGLERWMTRVDPLRAMGLLHAVHAAVQALAAAQGGRVDYAQGHTLLVVWPQAQAPQVHTAVSVAQACWNELLPMLRTNEDPDHPLGLETAVECGAFWAGVVGTVESRRLVVLGHTVADALAMLELASELAAPLLLGPVAGQRLAEAQQQEAQHQGAPATQAPRTAPAGASAGHGAPQPTPGLASPNPAAAGWALTPAARLLGRFVLPGQAVPKALHQVPLPVPAA